MEDFIARAMALEALHNGGGGGAPADAYSKSETDSKLSKKVDKVAGKGLSANDYTAADKALVGTIGSLRTVAETSRLTLGYAVKNILPNRAASTEFFTVQEDGSIVTAGAATALKQIEVYSGSADPFKGRQLRMTGCPAGGSATSYRMIMQNTTSGYSTIATDSGAGVTFTVDNSVTSVRLIISVYAGYSGGSVQFRPMIREAELGDDTYEPYRPTVEERLTAIEALLSAAVTKEE